MNKLEFEELVRCQKVINSDIRYIVDVNNSTSLVCKDIVIENPAGYQLKMDACFKPEIGTVKFNFSIKGVGPICRLCVNGTIHGDVGRNHKHELKDERDVSMNLPFAIRRDDLVDRSVKEIFDILCENANITFNGTFHSPEEL